MNKEFLLPGFDQFEGSYQQETLRVKGVREYFVNNHASTWHPLHFVLTPGVETEGSFVDGLQVISKLRESPAAFAGRL
jgi:hypothetical protein